MSLVEILLFVWPFAAVTLALCIGDAIRRSEDAPDGSAGDLLADQPFDVIHKPETLLYVPREWVA